MTSSESTTNGIKAVFFDFMGTCLDWHTSIINAFPTDIPKEERSRLALEWRQAFFDEIRDNKAGGPPENIDDTHIRTLRRVLKRSENSAFAKALASDSAGEGVDDQVLNRAIWAWHKMAAWPDVGPGLEQLRKICKDCDLVVLANGTTRLQLDLTRSSGLSFDMLFSSELLGSSKPSPEIYHKALKLLNIEHPCNAVMVAAHAYDLRAAKSIGMKTVYIRRWTDDLDETDDGKLSEENDGHVLENFNDLGKTIAIL